jgi:Ca-activated chloride channel family protein
MLLIDTSSSMEGRLALAKRAAVDLVGALRSGDRAGVILFHTTAAISHPLSDEHEGVIAAIRAAAPSGATAMYDAVYLGLHTLSHTRRAQDEVRRQALVVLSDGADNSSRITFDHALDAARAGDATVFTIVPGLPQGASSGLSPPWPDGNLRFQLRRLAEDTGGRAFLTVAAGELEDIYDQIGRELRAQYWLAYEPTATRPGFRRVSVRVTDPPGVQARTRSGYTAGPPTGLRMRRAAGAP